MKYLIVLGDGMADEPLERLHGKTPLAAAHTPMLDALARKSEIGTVQTVPNGVPVGSDTANLSILGYPPERYYTGRAPLEALGLGVHMNKNDIVLRANLVTLGTEAAAFSQCVLLDHSADEISTDEAAILMDVIRSEFENSDISFHTGTGYRHLLCWHNGELPVLAQPHDHLGEPIGAYLPQQPLLRELMRKSHAILDKHPINQARQARGLHKANGLWFWGAGTPMQLPPFQEQTGKRGVMVSATDLLHGIAAGIGLESVIVSGADGSLHTNFTGKALAAVQALREGADFAFVHLEAPDEMGHQGDAQRKMQAISFIDQQVIATVFRELCATGEAFRLLVLPDHATPVRCRTHTRTPVPYLLYDSTRTGWHARQQYNEAQAQYGRYFPTGSALLAHFLQK